MGTRVSGDSDPNDHNARVNKLAHKTVEAAGGAVSPAMAEQFWRRVLRWDDAPDTTRFRQLIDAGVELPDPADLSDQQVSAMLSRLIDALAKRRVYLHHTDHLCDRELYEQLWHQTLHRTTKDVPADPGWVQHVDMLGGCSRRDLHLYYKHYATERERGEWLQSWPEFDMPEHENAHHNRDRRLPQP